MAAEYGYSAQQATVTLATGLIAKLDSQKA